MIRLMSEQKKILDVREQNEVFGDIEMPLIPIIYDLETTGFKIDKTVLGELDAEYSGRLKEITDNIYVLAGEAFNINSPKQLGEVLFESLGLPAAKKTKTGYSTDIGVLEGLREKHGIIDPIIEYRTLAKLKSTYIDGLMPLVTKEGRLHTTINQIGAVTGRFSSTAPNLQNIPIRTSEGVKLRKAFVASDSDHILVDADYSQIELRILAHISGDENMLDAFNSGDDIHRRTAAQVFGVDEDDVTKQMRSSAKAVNFGIVYGISDFGLSRQLDIPRKQAGEFIAKYFETFPKVRQFMTDSVEFGRENGYVKTLYGRRIYLPQLRSSNYNQRTGAERVAMNAPIQGSAADIMKLAMIAVFNGLREAGLKSKLILQVHDELIIDALKSESEKAMRLVKARMEGVAKLKCELTADVDTGRSWYDAK
jgi:DNA polymerase-1